MLCNSCKNKNSTERCGSPALKNLQFCGKHVKSKTPRLWSVVNSAGDSAVKIQKVWRGWIVRYLHDLSGPGVLKRSLCHNEDDVITAEDKVHPSNYFAFHEDGKVFWFDFHQFQNRNHLVYNPLLFSINFREKILNSYNHLNILSNIFENSLSATSDTNLYIQKTMVNLAYLMASAEVNQNIFGQTL